MRTLLAVSVVLLALTGCTPNTDAAYTACVDSQLTLWHLNNPDATVEEFTEKGVAIGDECIAAAKADPAGFNERWTP